MRIEYKLLKYNIFITFLLLGCGKYEVYDWNIYNKPHIPGGSISADMQVYIDQYNKEAEDRGINANYTKLVSINWQDSITLGDQTLLGLTEVYKEPEGQLVSTITFSNELNQYPDVIKTLVITHELSHALLGIKHVERDSTQDLQIMYWQVGNDMINNSSNYEDPNMWNRYLDFLFGEQQLEVYQW